MTRRSHDATPVGVRSKMAKGEAAVFSIVVIFCLGALSAKNLGSAPPATGGQPWPMPQVFQPSNGSQVLSRNNFTFKVTGQTCGILEAAVDRYFKLIFYPDRRAVELRRRRDTTLRFRPYGGGIQVEPRVSDVPLLTSMTVNLMHECEEVPYMGMDEKCKFTFFMFDFGE